MRTTPPSPDNYQTLTFPFEGSRVAADFGDAYKDPYYSNAQKAWDSYAFKQKLREATPEDTDYYKARTQLIKDRQALIEDHVDRRIQLFFQQAVLCYNVPFLFTAQEAKDQTGKGSKVKLSGNYTHKTQAAHSSTFPCLIAHPKDAEGNVDLAKRFIYLKNSYSYNQHNSTMELPEEVNKVDTFIDGKTNENKLRAKAISLINDLAQKKITPEKATLNFLKIFKEELASKLDHYTETKGECKVVKIYHQRVSEVLEEAKDNPEVFDQLIGVRLELENAEAGPSLRDLVYQKRYQLMQQAELIESKIAKTIFAAQKEMTGVKASSYARINPELRYLLLENANEKERRFFEKLFCTSIDQLKTQLQNNEQRLRTTTKKVRDFKVAHATKITQLMANIWSLFNELEALELEYRADLFKSLRVEHKNWSQDKFSRRFKARYPNTPMSQSTVSRLEHRTRDDTKNQYLSSLSNRKKDMDLPLAKKIAQTFQIDNGLFMAGLISSSY